MVLDFVLADPAAEWHETQADKVEHFTPGSVCRSTTSHGTPTRRGRV
jgi:hypothetical protein